MMQDGGGLDHFDHKGALARCQVILRSDAGENAIHQPDPGCFSRNVAADLCHEDDERNLAQIG